MKKFLLSLALSTIAIPVLAAEPFCKTGKAHPIDIQLERETSSGHVTTASIMDAEQKAYERWDAELNRLYKELMSALEPEDQVTLRNAQRAWLAFREAESKVWWLEQVSDGGSLQRIIVATHSREMLKQRVCELSIYRARPGFDANY